MALGTSLSDVVRQLQHNKKSTDDTTKAVSDLASTIRMQIDMDIAERERQRLIDLENRREGQGRPGPTPGAPSGGSSSDSNFSLGFGLTALAAAAGAIVGAIRGHLKAIQTVSKTLGNLLEGLGSVVKSISSVVSKMIISLKNLGVVPQFVVSLASGVRKLVTDTIDIISKMFMSVGNAFTSVRQFVQLQAGNIRTSTVGIIDDVAKWFNNLTDMLRGSFSLSGQGTISTVLENFKQAFAVFTQPIVTATQYLMSFVNNADSGPGFITRTLNYFGEMVGKMGGIFKVASEVLEKIFWPLGVIIATIDTIKGAIQGYAEGGIFGALEGAIDGLFSSLIGGPLDLIKNITSWVLEKLGFENASAWLDSFSFSELFDTITDKFFGGISSVVEFVGDLFGNMKDLLVTTFNYELTRIINGFKIMFEEISTFIANIPDQLYLMISKNLRFGMPTIEIPLPEWLQYMGAPEKFTLLRGFDVGVGDAETQSAATARIAGRNQTRDAEVSRLNDDINAKAREMNDAWSKLTSQFKAQTVVVQDNSAKSTQTTNNQNVSVTNPTLSYDAAWYQRRATLKQGF